MRVDTEFGIGYSDRYWLTLALVLAVTPLQIVKTAYYTAPEKVLVGVAARTKPLEWCFRDAVSLKTFRTRCLPEEPRVKFSSGGFSTTPMPFTAVSV